MEKEKVRESGMENEKGRRERVNRIVRVRERVT